MGVWSNGISEPRIHGHILEGFSTWVEKLPDGQSLCSSKRGGNCDLIPFSQPCACAACKYSYDTLEANTKLRLTTRCMEHGEKGHILFRRDIYSRHPASCGDHLLSPQSLLPNSGLGNIVRCAWAPSTFNYKSNLVICKPSLFILLICFLLASVQPPTYATQVRSAALERKAWFQAP
jgi:hypothetical protein